MFPSRPDTVRFFPFLSRPHGIFVAVPLHAQGISVPIGRPVNGMRNPAQSHRKTKIYYAGVYLDFYHVGVMYLANRNGVCDVLVY